MISLIDLLTQGRNDPGIFKAIFILGSAASGKSTITKKLIGRQQLSNIGKYTSYTSFSPYGLKYLNIDDVFQKLVHDLSVNTNFNQLTDQQYDNITQSPFSKFQQAKRITRKRKHQYIDSRLGLIIDKTGANPIKIQKIYNQLTQLGYQCICIFVSAQLQTVKNRNRNRQQRQLRDQFIQQS